MKLCLVNAFFHPYRGGTEKHMVEIGRRLARKHEVHVFTAQLPGTPPREVVEGIHVWRTPARLLKAPLIYPPPLPLAGKAMRHLEAIHRRERFEAFHLHGRWFPDFAAVVPFAHKRGVPVALTLHNARPRGIGPATDFLGTLYDRFYGAKVIRSVDRTVAVSEFVRQDVAAYGADLSRIEVIPNGVDTSVFRPGPPVLRERLGGYDPQLLYVGRLIRQKGLPLLLVAVRDLVKDHPGLGVALVGQGKERPRLEGLARRLGIEKHVTFPGFVEEGLLPQAYASADIFVLPSLWEVFGIVLVEAMACGTPCVAAAVGGVPEVVENHRTGLLFRERDAEDLTAKLRVLVEAAEERGRLGRQACQAAKERFDWDRVAARTESFYGRLLSKRSLPGRGP